MTSTNDLTSGSVTSKLLRFFFPMLLTNLLQQVYSVTDTAIVGKGLGDNALGAVGNLSALSFLIIGFSMGMSNGFAVIIAQNYGAGNISAVKKAVASAVKLAAALTVILTAAACLFLRPVLLLLQTDSLILDDSLKYGYIIFGGLAATVAYNLCAGILRSVGDSKTPFIAIMVSSVINIALDSIFIFGLRTGVEGAAAATVIAQVISTVICFVRIRRIPELRAGRSDFARDTAMSLRLLKNGVPMACMNSITAVGVMVVQGYVNGRGVMFTSAYSVCSRYINLFMLPALTAGVAASPFVSQNFGAGKKERIRQGVLVCSGIALISYAVLGTVMLVFSRQLGALMLNDSATIALTAQYLRICGVFLIFLNLLFVFRNAVLGMGYPFLPMISGILEMSLRIPAIMILLPRVGFRATGFAEAAAWTGAMTLNVTAFIVYYRKMGTEKA